MQIKIIKRSDREQTKKMTPAVQSNQPKESDARRAMATTIKFWIEDLRQRREQESISVKKLFSEELCA